MKNQTNAATLIHLQDTTIVQCLDNTELLFHLSPEDLTGRKLDDLECYFLRLDGTQLSLEEHPLNRVLRTKKQLADVVFGIYNERNNSLLWVNFQGYPEFDGDGEVCRVVATYRDATESTQKHIEKTLSQQIKDEWEKTFDALHDVVTILSPELVIVRANKAAYTTFGFSYGQLVGRRCYEVFHGKTEPCDLCPVWQPQTQSSTSGIVFNERLQKSFEVTSSPVFEDDGTLKYLVHTARDITQKLKDEEERNILSAAVEQTTESVLISDARGIIQYVNQAYAATTGYSRRELIGKNLGYLNVNKDSERLFDEIFDTLKKGGTWQGRLTSQRKDGSHFEENAAISPIFQGNGEISNFVAVKRDISKEEQLQRQLQQAMKMEAIGTLAGGIAHDFNNILSAMIGYGQIAKGRLSREDPLCSDIEQILLAGDRAANLVKQILTFSRRDTQDNFHPLKVQYIIREVFKLVRSSFPSTIELRQNIDNGCPPILADPGQIHQVLMNLCTNAKQAIGHGYGTLTVSLQEVNIAEPQLISPASLLISGSYVRLAVEDNGCGMSEEIRTRIFDPFFTTKPKDQGTGLGLSVVHGIVEKHGGVITVETREDVGSAFHIYFPVVMQDIQPDEDAAEPDSRGTERIMVVDDEVVIGRLMERMLDKLGYAVKLHTNSLEAARSMRRAPHDIDLLITDMTMPNMTGAELAREALSLRPELPIIMTTGYSELIDEEKASRIGITKFMLKPVNKKALVQMVRKVLDDAKNSCS